MTKSTDLNGSYVFGILHTAPISNPASDAMALAVLLGPCTANAPPGEDDKTQKQKAFSLIELLIVVAIILTHRCYSHSKPAPFAHGRQRSIRRRFRPTPINTSEITYNSTWGVGFATALSNLGGGASRTGVFHHRLPRSTRC